MNTGTVADRTLADLYTTRARGPGGTIRLWNTALRGEPGAKFAPLDPFDFAVGDDGSGWPFDRREIESDYVRAQSICGLGVFAYDGEAWVGPDRPVLPVTGGLLTTRVYQFASARGVADANLGILRRADNVRLREGVTVVGLTCDAAGRRVISARAVDAEGRSVHVTARTFVLACGAIENARLLLAGAGVAPRSAWNRSPWLGRGFMEHPRDYSLTLTPREPGLFRAAKFYDAHAAEDGTFVGGRFALTEEAVRRHGLPNASITLLPRLKRPQPDPAASPGLARRVLERLRVLGRTRGQPGYGWSDVSNAADVYRDFRLVVNVEQRPHTDNRIALGDTRDGTGLPRVVAHWRWRADEQARLERLRQAIASWLEPLGTVVIRPGLPPDPNAHHHAGTTRMSADPGDGVVDSDCRVHGTDNLFVAGGSVMPTAGFANPTLTIVALAVRLARTIRQECRAAGAEP
jgi:choline dehydrogenase-like flavoprotein